MDKNGFRFSKEELNYWPTCRLSSFQQQQQQCKVGNSFHNHCRLGMSRERFPITETSFLKRLRQPHSKDSIWAGRPTINGHGVPQKSGMASQRNRAAVNGHGVPANQGMMSQFGLQKTSSNLGAVWSTHSFLPGVQNNGGVKLWQPLTGSKTQSNGNNAHGMSPSWAVFNFPGKASMQAKFSSGPNGPFYARLQRRFQWWRRNTQDPSVLHLITHGVTAAYPLPCNLSMQPCFRNQEETQMALESIQEYLDVGALKEISLQQAKHLIPWFVIKKGEKLRLITNCKELNNYLDPKPFRLENWQEIFPSLRKGMWAAKIDLKHAYFHLQLADSLRPYMCIQVQQKVFQFQAACFGLSTLPQQWQSVMKVFLKKWRKQGILTWVYLDDILLVGNSPQAVQKHLQILLQDLEASGMVVNQKKSQLVPTQQVEHLGFLVDLKKGLLQVPQEKMKNIRKELGKLLTHSEMSCRKMAAILGATRSFLMAMPFLRAFTDQLVQFVNQLDQIG
jgi:hypothetical protein